MRIGLVSLIFVGILACKGRETSRVLTPPVGSSASTAAFSADDVDHLIAGTVIGYRPSTGEIAVLVRGGLRSFSIRDGRPGANPDFLVEIDDPRAPEARDNLLAVLRSYSPVTGLRLGGSTRFPRMTYDIPAYDGPIAPGAATGPVVVVVEDDDVEVIHPSSDRAPAADPPS